MLTLLLLACTDKAGESTPPTESEPIATTPTDARPVVGNAGPSCAPNDGAAVVFTFELPSEACDAEADPDTLFRIAVWHGAPLPLGTYDLSDPAVGAGYTGSIPISSGSITITGWEGFDTDANIAGHYEVVIATGGVVHAVFEGVPWCASDTIMCG